MACRRGKDLDSPGGSLEPLAVGTEERAVRASDALKGLGGTTVGRFAVTLSSSEMDIVGEKESGG